VASLASSSSSSSLGEVALTEVASVEPSDDPSVVASLAVVAVSGPTVTVLGPNVPV
jgi:hypothetical protein